MGRKFATTRLATPAVAGVSLSHVLASLKGRALMPKACEGCGKGLGEGRTSRARYCGDTCRRRGNRRKAAAAGVATVAAGLSARVAAELGDRVDTVGGQQALALAWRIESPFETGSAVAAMSRELSRVMESAPAGGVTVDPVDELQRRRDAKRTI